MESTAHSPFRREQSIRPPGAEGVAPRVPFEKADIEQTVASRFTAIARLMPDQVALTGAGSQWTYGALDRRANGIAHLIHDRIGAAPGPVALVAPQSPEMILAVLSILKAGKTSVALHPSSPIAQQAAILADVSPRLVLTTSDCEARARQAVTDRCPVLVLDDSIGDMDDGPANVAGPHDPSVLFYTSGTTGVPKGVVKNHRSVLHRIWLAVQHDGVGTGDRQSLITHSAFSASETDTFGALLTGATLCVFDFTSEGMPALGEWLRREAITLFHPPVLLFRRFLDGLGPADRFDSVRMVALAGEQVLPGDVERWRRHFPNSVLMHRFSATETALLALARVTTEDPPDLSSTLAGIPVADKTLELRNDSGLPVPIGEEGELVVRSPFIASGYWRPDGTIAAFAPDPEQEGSREFRTGDRGRFLPDGRFQFLGRRDRQVKIRGFRVELAAIEAALTLHPDVREVAIALTGNDADGRSLVAWIAPAAGRVIEPSSLRAFLQERLPPYMVPVRWHVMASLPITPTGKIDRTALVDIPGEGRRTTVAAPPGTPTALALASLFQDVLSLERAGPDDHFFDLGGHSLLAAQLVARVEATFGVRLPLATLLRAPTVRQLALEIDAHSQTADWRALVPIQPRGRRRPVFAVAGLGGNVLSYRELSRLLDADQPFYGLQSQGLDGRTAPLERIEDIAAAFVQEIRRVQPHGPYTLAGVCMGGVVAYEMARQLHAAGELMATLILLDTPTPTGTGADIRSVPLGGRSPTLRFIRRRLGLHARTLARLRGRERFAYLKGRLGVVSEIVARRDLLRDNRSDLHAQAVADANRAAFRNYRPGSYPGRAVMFRAQGRAGAEETARRNAWNALIEGGVRHEEVPGDNSGFMLRSPNVEVLARKVAAVLEEAVVPSTMTVRDDAEATLETGAMPTFRAGSRTTADLLLERLVAHGVRRVFINPGSSIAPVQESLARFAHEGRPAPEFVLCLHESVALAAAHGSYMVTGQVQVVMVHTDVGTLNLGANLHNAQRGRAGVVILAGESPLAASGDDRNRDTDWIQEQADQSAIVAGYVKWRCRVTDAPSVGAMIDRAFQLAATAPAGPVYLTLPRDVQLAPVAHDDRSGRPPLPIIAEATPAPSAVSTAADWLIAARQPLILTAYAGRHSHAVSGLVRLAETIGAPVIELRQRLNFPSTHPLHLGFCAMPYLERADCVLVVDHDVPWVPAQGSPSPGCRVIQIDVDPHKRDVPNWHLPVDLVMQADAGAAAFAIAEEVARRASTEHRARIQSRRNAIAVEHRALADGWSERARALESRTPIAPDFAAACLNEIIDADSIVVNEAVSNNPVLWHHVRLDAPGTWFQSLGSGLGWGLGAALGVKLATPSRTVISIVGDGSWVFGSPLAVYWAAERCGTPFLTVVLNNRAYAATIDAIAQMAPHGAARASGHYPACNLPDPSFHAPVAAALGLWARSVSDPAHLRSTLREALAEVRGGRSALVDIQVASSRTERGASA
jgi:acetolactate synthase-1/2/3 large subunit